MSSSPGAIGATRNRFLRALLQPDCYPHPVDRIEHLQTHISDVLLTGAYAYKLKKPLALGFLDFSTLDRRRHFCEEELRLNRRTAPDLYLSVVPITGDAEHPRVGGPGVAFEYALQMRQFDQSGLLERVLARGELSDSHIDELAQLIAQFHAALPRAPAQSEYGTPATIMAPALQNFDQLRPLVDEDTDRARLDQLQQWTSDQHRSLQPLFAQRREGGFVRECHGDLHLANMVLIGGRVRIFDCIEFNPELRWIDVMNEVAFVAMDLTQRGHAHFAYRFLDRYLQLTGDYAGVPLLRYYMVYRALVRAKVAVLRAQQEDVAPATRRSLAERCRAHVELAASLISAQPPLLVIMHGLSGSGKTSASQVLLETIPAIRIRSDVERKRLQGLSADARTGSALGTGLYGASASEATYERLRLLARTVLIGGFSALVDAAFLRHAQRDRLRSLAQELGLRFAIVHAQASPGTLRSRIARRAAAAGDASEATIEVLEYQLQTQDPLDAEELRSTLILDTERDDESVIAEKATQKLLAPGDLSG